MKSTLLVTIDNKGKGCVKSKGDLLLLGQVMLQHMVNDEKFATIINSAARAYYIINQQEQAKPKIVSPHDVNKPAGSTGIILKP